MRCVLKSVILLAVVSALFACGLYIFRDTYFCRAGLRDGLIYILERRFPDMKITVRDLHTDYFHHLILDGISVARGERKVFLNRLEAQYSIKGLFDKTIYEIALTFDAGEIESKEVRGKLKGAATISIQKGEIEKLEARLASTDDGGKMNIGLLNNLMNYMPRGLARDQLKGALAGSGAFQYERAELEVKLVEGIYKIRLYLKGYHILEFSVSVPQELVGGLLKLKEI